MAGADQTRTAEPRTEGGPNTVVPFGRTLMKHGLKLTREHTHTLQVNVGFLCNQGCRHCHLDAGPHRTENMDADTVGHVVAYAERNRFEVIDITGGAPELNPHITPLTERLAALTPRLMFRSNLSALNDDGRSGFREMLGRLGVVVVASFPSLNENQTDSQRGRGIFDVSVAALKKLNALGYGDPSSGLELNLVSNPSGAFLPPSQDAAEKRFRQVLASRYGIAFTRLYSFANVPLGRYRQWLVDSGNLDGYTAKLAGAFNLCAVAGVMCRTLVAVNWEGYLYDCDFNLSLGLHLGKRRVHVTELGGPPDPGTPIATADHCYACTAGAGFT